jgi:hypothetical protein
VKELFDDLIQRGETVIDEFITEPREETLHLEFKSTTSGPGQLNKDDAKLIAKALSGFANAEGGLLVVGVRTKRRYNIDVAVAKSPIDEVEKVRNRVVALLSDALSPPHSGITVEAIKSPDGTGYLAILVEPSENRPHMSVKEHRYFRRGSEGTRVMEHGEVKDLMLAPRQGKLGISHYFQLDRPTSEHHSYDFDWVLCVRNDGKVPVRAPFLTCHSPFLLPPRRTMNSLVHRTTQSRKNGIFGRSDLILHVEDEVEIARFSTGIDFRHAGGPYSSNTG